MFRAAVLLLAAVSAPAVAQGPRTTSPDGKLVAHAEGKTISVSTGQPAKLLMKMVAHAEDVTALAYSPDGKMLFSVDKGGAVSIFDSATGKQIRKLGGPKGATQLAVSPDGRTLSVKAGKVTKKYSVATGAEIK